MTDAKKTPEELIAAEIREVYNSGNCKLAVEKSVEFYKQYPEQLLAKYSYAVMHGDYSVAPEHSGEEKKRLMEIANTGLGVTRGGFYELLYGL